MNRTDVTDRALRRSCQVLLAFNCIVAAWVVIETRLPVPRAATPAQYRAPAPDLRDWPQHEEPGVSV